MHSHKGSTTRAAVGHLMGGIRVYVPVLQQGQLPQALSRGVNTMNSSAFVGVAELMMVGGTLKTLIHLYSSFVRCQLLPEIKISLVMHQEILLLKSDAKKFVSTVFYATPFPATGSRLDHREGCSHIVQLW